MGYILGIDEAGRGAWAGPLVVGAVILGDKKIKGLTDSKLLTREQRQEFAEAIHASCLFYGLGWVSSKEVDSRGLTSATKLGIKRAIKNLAVENLEIIIDGNINYLSTRKDSRCVIKADLTIPAVSAAGIIAKVARDRYMIELADKFPVFGFDSHVGYGTSRHSENLKKHGICREHRLSFNPVSLFI
ncbi:MAG TPA: ribonuclease HII [Candidatus Saccharimonadales bacterium]|nr:ribonuclease HII [Candidatus Saccharimonadales bacterium]